MAKATGQVPMSRALVQRPSSLSGRLPPRPTAIGQVDEPALGDWPRRVVPRSAGSGGTKENDGLMMQMPLVGGPVTARRSGRPPNRTRSTPRRSDLPARCPHRLVHIVAGLGCPGDVGQLARPGTAVPVAAEIEPEHPKPCPAQPPGQVDPDPGLADVMGVAFVDQNDGGGCWRARPSVTMPNSFEDPSSPGFR